MHVTYMHHTIYPIILHAASLSLWLSRCTLNADVGESQSTLLAAPLISAWHLVEHRAIGAPILTSNLHAHGHEVLQIVKFQVQIVKFSRHSQPATAQ
eukprot:COSAG01_NODE_18498_length_1072_cov_0.899281_1_plen_97_part_00